MVMTRSHRTPYRRTEGYIDSSKVRSDNEISDGQSSEDENTEDDSSEFDAMPSRYKIKSTPRVYTYRDLEGMILEKSLQEFKAPPSIDTISFSPCPSSKQQLIFTPTCDKRLLFGKIDSPIPENRERVYLYIGGEGNNRICFGGEKNLEKMDNNSAALVAPAKPFWYLFSHGRALDRAENQRLRALACFLFLSAGHVETVQHYADIEVHLIDAIRWYARGIAAESRESKDEGGQQDVQVGLEANVANNVSGSKRTRSGSADGERDALPPPKKLKLAAVTSHMQQCYKQLGDYIAVYEDQSAELRRNAAVSEQVEDEARKKDEKIQELEQQLQTKSADCERLEAEITSEKAKREEVETKRQDAEKKLSMVHEMTTKFLGGGQ